MKIKAFLALLATIVTLVFLRLLVDGDSLFVIAEAVHAIGISVLFCKLLKESTCTGTKPCLFYLFSIKYAMVHHFHKSGHLL